MISYTVHISGTQEELAKIRKLGDKLVDMSAVLKNLGGELKTYYSSTVFKAEGSVPGIGRWKALSPAYKKWKGQTNHYPNKGLLIASGTMQKSFRATNTRNSLTIDNTDKKFAWHQNGTGFGGGSLLAVARGRSLFKMGGIGPGRGHNLPARPMLVVNNDVTGMVATEIKSDVERKIASIM